ncbi:MAG: selenide, water dikinase SelD [Boseongicola sp.]
MIEAIPYTREVVLIGGGHTHALLLRRWGMSPVPGARLTLINPGPVAPYTGMLPGYVAGHYERSELDIDLVKLARFAGARLILGRATGLDRVLKRVRIAGRPDIAYDIASIDVGITSNLSEIRGFSDHGIAAKPLETFADRWSEFLAKPAPGPVAVVGGGVGGVELALAIRYAQTTQPIDVTIIESERLLNGLAPRARSGLMNELSVAGITVFECKSLVDISPSSVRLNDGTELASNFTVSAAGARPYDWLSETGLHLTNGYISVDAQLRSITDPSIYAVGDCAFFEHAPRPKAGVFAVRAAPVLTANIRADLTGGTRREFRPQKHYLKLISLGRRRAVSEKFGLSLSGGWIWHWKDRVDRRFMHRLGSLPKMATKHPPQNAAMGVSELLSAKPLCGGCGAKVGEQILVNALEGVSTAERKDVITPIGEDGAVLKVGDCRQVITTDHLRAFWPDPYLMTRIAALHAMGDIWAMGASPQALLTQITLPRMSEPLQNAWLDECLAAADSVAQDTGAALVGGHTALGSEFTIGFTVTGLLGNDNSLSGRAQIGDALVLTRPIGSGVLMAAEMSGDADGREISVLLDQMSRSQAEAAAVLAACANALTDVTGFGLAGHAARLAMSAGLTAEIQLERVPFYPGAVRLSGQGVESSLFSANLAAHTIELPDDPSTALLFDPQTAGGLLAAIPKDDAEKILDDLPKGSRIIGKIVAKSKSSIAVR